MESVVDMNLDIGNFNLTSDKHNVTVHERYEKEDGSEVLRFVGYYGSVPAALRALLKTELKQSGVQSVNELLDVIDKHEKEIVKLIASVDFDAYRIDNHGADLGFLD